ncbi:ankyrin repeat-containing domain protein [Trichoderma camerunense]
MYNTPLRSSQIECLLYLRIARNTILNSCQIMQQHIEAAQCLSKQERKRLQNRIAQRVYRQNQKQRILALEAAASRSLNTSFLSHSTLPTEIPDERSILSAPISDSIIDASNACLTGLEADISGMEHGDWEADCDWNGTNDATAKVERVTSTRQGATALHIAVKTGNNEMVRFLIGRGADLSKQDSRGNMAIHVAARLGHVGLLKLLIDHSAKTDEINFLGQTPLYLAVQSESKDAVQLLLGAMADINIKDSMGNSILHIAVETGSVPIVDLLLSSGADINA